MKCLWPFYDTQNQRQWWTISSKAYVQFIYNTPLDYTCGSYGIIFCCTFCLEAQKRKLNECLDFSWYCFVKMFRKFTLYTYIAISINTQLILIR